MSKSQLRSKKIAVIGGGLTGLSCAYYLAQAGQEVTLIEAAPALGGRARIVKNHRVSLDTEQYLDNGPHLMLGAYREFFSLIHHAHVCVNAATPRAMDEFLTQYFYRLPFAMRSKHIDLKMGGGGRWISFWQTLRQSTGWKTLESFSLLRLMWSLWINETTDETVTQWLNRLNVSKRWQDDVMIPLCLSALNTEPNVASAQVLIEVLRRVFLGEPSGWEMRWSKVDLATIYINPLRQAILQRGGEIISSQRIRVAIFDNLVGAWRLTPWHNSSPAVTSATYGQVVMALHPLSAEKLLSASVEHELNEATKVNMTATISFLQQMESRAIANVSFFALPSLSLEAQLEIENLPILMCQSYQGMTLMWLNHAKITPKRYKNAEGRAQAPLMTVIYSCHVPEQIEAFSHQAWREHCQSLPLLSKLEGNDAFSIKVIHETLATHAASVDKLLLHRLRDGMGKMRFSRLAPNIALNPESSLWLTGDYLDPKLPATLETAVMAGKKTADAIVRNQ